MMDKRERIQKKKIFISKKKRCGKRGGDMMFE
jgi:hypothetical protein